MAEFQVIVYMIIFLFIIGSLLMSDNTPKRRPKIEPTFSNDNPLTADELHPRYID